jgi:glycosyltransferase involved in cell wall biosynthesis
MEEQQRKLKILYLITKSNFGGAQRYVYDLATSAHKLGHDVVVGFGGNGELAQKLVEAGIRTVPIPALARDMNPLTDFKSFMRLLDLFAEEAPDVLHLNSSKVGALGTLAGRMWNVWVLGRRIVGKSGRPMRIIFTGHGWAFNEERGDFARSLIACAHWLTITLSHKTIAVSRKTRGQIGSLPFVLHKVVVIYNGVGLLTTLPKEEALHTILGDKQHEWLGNKPVIVGTLAELHKNKGLTFALEGMVLLKKQTPTPFIFLVLGEGEEHTHLDALIVKLGLEHTVFLAGYKKGGVALLSAFDIFLLPSITEAFPYAILEAGNVGLPVVATAVGGIPEVIDDMQSGILIQSKNPGEVARALSHLIDNPDRRTQLGNAIAERIRGRFNIETMVKETLALYSEK